MSVTINAGVEGKASLNLANRNFATLWNALGLNAEWCGEIDGRALKQAIIRLDHDLVRRDPQRDGNCYDCGITYDRVSRYVDKLIEITDEAVSGESLVQWS